MNATRAIWTLRAVEVTILVVGMVLPVVAQRIRMDRKQRCFNNVAMLDHALTCGAVMEKQLRPGDPLTTQDVTSYCKRGVIPRCPSGAAYQFEFRVCSHPICPVHGDLVAETGLLPHQPLERPLQLDYPPPWVIGMALCSSLVALALPVTLYVVERRKTRAQHNTGG